MGKYKGNNHGYNNRSVEEALARYLKSGEKSALQVIDNLSKRYREEDVRAAVWVLILKKEAFFTRTYLLKSKFEYTGRKHRRR